HGSAPSPPGSCAPVRRREGRRTAGRERLRASWAAHRKRNVPEASGRIEECQFEGLTDAARGLGDLDRDLIGSIDGQLQIGIGQKTGPYAQTGHERSTAKGQDRRAEEGAYVGVSRYGVRAANDLHCVLQPRGDGL